MLDNLLKSIVNAVDNLRNQSPIVASLTNFVTMNFVANTQLAVGANAAMVQLPEEATAMASVAKSIYINMGTLLPICKESFPAAAKAAVQNNIPWILDPVAAGMGTDRENIFQSFKHFPPSVIRGNASEIISLAQSWNLNSLNSTPTQNSESIQIKGVGVDSSDTVESAEVAAIALAKFTKGVIAVSGEKDLITDGEKVYRCLGGSFLATRITGAGCSLGGVIASYATITSPLIAALTGTIVYNYCQECAEKYITENSKGTGTFQIEFVDALSLVKGKDLLEIINRTTERTV
ncbi:MAG: hydroxyethylthiazole kinase [Candidatus Ancillula sp.]|jgi:hydroxyethylthiazole kinase|nr:hydroxyethylthiazole kinase [Candidatus Ancillula sp.]